MNNTDSSKFKRPLSSSSIKNDPDDDLRPPVKLKVKIGGNVVVQPQTANTEKLVSFYLIILSKDVVFPGLFEFSGIRKFSGNSKNSREISGIPVYFLYTKILPTFIGIRL